ncbi:MAG: FecR domain-containing protein [Rhodospirillales bacterium]
MRKASLRTGVLTAAVALTVAMVAHPAFADKEVDIGVTAASNPSAKGYPPVSVGHLLGVGVKVVGDERVITNDDGRAQLLFLDHSALTIGPNSDIVLDKFIYDPDAGAGKLAFSAVKGVFRLVGGKISKNEPVTIKTPTATIGIRGGIAIVSIGENGSADATFLFGKDMTVKADCEVVKTTRPGSSVKVSSLTDPCGISDPVLLSAEQLSAIVQQLEQTPGQPGDPGVEAAALGALTGPAAGPPSPPPPPFIPPPINQISDSIVRISGEGPPPPPPPPPPLPRDPADRRQ